MISRNHTATYGPDDTAVRAGAPASVARQATLTLAPSYDPNSNDVWSKRLNTLRRFTGLVSRWIYRQRVTVRIRAFRKTLHEAGVTNAEEGAAFIIHENATYKSRAASAKPKSRSAAAAAVGGGEGEGARLTAGASHQDTHVVVPIAAMVCGMRNPIEEKKEHTDKMLAEEEFSYTPDMVRRILFPKFIADDGTKYEPMESAGVEKTVHFDDRTFFQLKLRPEYLSMGYAPLPIPKVPIIFPSTQVQYSCILVCLCCWIHV